MIKLYDTSISRLLRDIKANGYCYIKSANTAKRLRNADPDLIITYDKEDGSYKATYYKQ